MTPDRIQHVKISVFVAAIGYNLKKHNNLYFYEIIVLWDVALHNVIDF
jgi:hypothetical protein